MNLFVNTFHIKYIFFKQKKKLIQFDKKKLKNI